MMNNEVYIDGVDVSECEHLWKDNSVIELNFCRINFDNNYFSNGIPCCDKCNKHPDCYFKQLQRTKKELEQSKNYAELLKANRCHHTVLGECSQEHHSNCVGKKQCILDLEQIINDLKAENEKLKKWLENKEKAYNHLCNANNRKKEQIKNLNYMLFEEKDMTTQEWKLKYRLANKERKFIQFKEITNKRLNNYKQALEEIEEIAYTTDFDIVDIQEVVDKVLK